LPLWKGDSSLLGSKKTTFSSRYEMCLFGFLFLGEWGICQQNLMPIRGVEPWENHPFPQGGMLKFTYKGHFLTIKIAYERFLDWKSKMWKHALVPLLHVEIFFWKKLKSQFLVVFQSFVFGRFRQILEVLSRFGQILLHWQWLIARSNLGWNLESLITFEP
jgi:hypothetical protein